MDAFRINDLRVEPSAGEVTGPAGRAQLDPKVMGVLQMLAERAGQVVPRDDLLARLWPDVVVSDDALSRCLYELRRQLGAAGGSERHRALIETLPKRGYRLNADVAPAETAQPAGPGAPAPPRWRRAAFVAAAAVLAIAVALPVVRHFRAPPSQARVAVLPFLDLSAAGDQRYLADGLAEEILDRLSQSQDLQVIARTSSFSFRERPVDVGVIGRRLEVTHVLEGSVRTSGTRVRVTAQLISTADGAHVWSDTYERDRRDLFALQDAIAIAVAGALEAKLGPTPKPHTTENVDALVQYSQGEYFYYRRAEGDIGRAIRAFEQAVATDPRYAKAWAALAGAFSLQAHDTDPPDAALVAKQGEAARRAVQLDPKLGVAQLRLAQFYFETGRLDEARRHSAQAEVLAPDDPLVLSRHADIALQRGDPQAAIGFLRRAVATDPLSLVYRNNLGAAFESAGEYEAALREYRVVRDSRPGYDAENDRDIARMLVMLRRHADAAAVADAMPAGRVRDQVISLLVFAPGRRADADAALARLAGEPNAVALRSEILDDVLLAESYAFHGMADEAFATLEGKKRALESRTGGPALDLWYLQHESRISPFLRPLQADARWQQFMAGYPGPYRSASGH